MLVASQKNYTRTLENTQNSQFNSSPASAHAKDQPKVDMLTLFSDVVVAKKLNDLEKLLEMKILLTSHHVDHMIKLVFFVLIYPRGPSAYTRAQRAENASVKNQNLHDRAVHRYHGSSTTLCHLVFYTRTSLSVSCRPTFNSFTNMAKDVPEDRRSQPLSSFAWQKLGEVN